MKKPRTVCAWMLTALCALVSNGCMTTALWKDELVESYHEPSLAAEVSLFSDPVRQDVWVRYQEFSPWSDAPRVRSFYLGRNAGRLVRNEPPRFEDAPRNRVLTALPVFTNAPVGTPLKAWAVVTDNNEITIHESTGATQGPYTLPVYRGSTGNLKLALLTPVTAVVDASIVGGVLGYFFVYAVCESGTTFSGPRHL